MVASAGLGCSQGRGGSVLDVLHEDGIRGASIYFKYLLEFDFWSERINERRTSYIKAPSFETSRVQLQSPDRRLEEQKSRLETSRGLHREEESAFQ